MSRERVDLANEIIRESLRPRGMIARAQVNPDRIREAVTRARRFVLDDSMSQYMGHLSTVPFSTHPQRRGDTMESLRHSAELPFDDAWFEWDNVELRRGLIEAGANKYDAFGNLLESDPENIIRQEGALCCRIGDVCIARIFVMHEGAPTPLPFVFAWTTGDAHIEGLLHGVLPHERWPMIDLNAARFAHGIIGYDSPHTAVVHDRPWPKAMTVPVVAGDVKFETSSLCVEFGGTLRYLLCFLATLNTTPVAYDEVVPSRGYLARGAMRKYMRYSTVRLILPSRVTMRKMAMRAVAVARRGRHEVRGFFRSKPERGGIYCASRSDHIWSAEDGTGHSYCEKCRLARVWIKDYWRGDASLGYVGKSKYSVERGKIPLDA